MRPHRGHDRGAFDASLEGIDKDVVVDSGFVSLEIADDLLAQVDAVATRLGVDRSTLIANALRRYLDRDDDARLRQAYRSTRVESGEFLDFLQLSLPVLPPW